jgi:hypothetical protein
MRGKYFITTCASNTVLYQTFTVLNSMVVYWINEYDLGENIVRKVVLEAL